MKKSKLEETLALQMRAVHIDFDREIRFHPVRRWRFDFGITKLKIGIECEGLTNPKLKSRHTTNSGFTEDCEKYNAAALEGWVVLRFTWPMIKSGKALIAIEKMIEYRLKIIRENRSEI
jgi:very-short-patch-repair endonuclease